MKYVKISCVLSRYKKNIADKIVSSVTNWGLNMDNLVGQGCDGAATMRSNKNLELLENATYVHCRSHVLALALAAGCKQVTEIQNLFDNVGKLAWYSGGSAKRQFLSMLVLQAKKMMI